MERGEGGSKQKPFPVTLRTFPLHGSNWSFQCFSPDPNHDPDPDPKPDPTKSVSHSVVSLCSPMDCSPPGSSVHGILQARTLE